MLTSSVRNTANRPRPELNRPGTIPRRYIGSAFFYACALLISSTATPHAEPQCDSRQFDETASVRYVIDGDTLLLKDGRKLRLIGLDTPELGHDGKPGEAYARKARQALQKLLSRSTDIGLIRDTARVDRYGRQLAHVFTTDGQNVQRQLLASGLATPMVIPPSSRFTDCYARAANRAMTDSVGLWSRYRYRLIQLPDDSDYHTGFNRIAGQISSVRERKGWLNIRLNESFSLSIHPDDVATFTSKLPALQTATRIEAHGWVSRYRGELNMRLHHPAQLIIYN